MKKMKRAGALLLALVLTLSLAACAGGGGGSAQTPAEAVAAAQKKMADIKNLDAAITMEMGMSMEGQTMGINMSMNMSMLTDPVQAKIAVDMDMGELGSQQMEMYMEEKGDNSFVLYVTDGTIWAAQTVSAEDVGQYDAQSSMDMYLDSTSEFKSAGTEKLPSGEADKYTGVIKGDSMAAVMEQSGALDSLATVLGSTDAIAELYKDLGDMPVSIWVDKATGYPVRYEMDMTDMLSQLMSKALTAAGATEADLEKLKIDKMSMAMECSNFNNATPFTIPEEALAAAG